MSLLNVTVKRAKYIGEQATQFNTYVTLKLQNVKSTTVTVKGSEPHWGQDFLFEINNVSSGLLVEVWTKGIIWDRALGYCYIPLRTIPCGIEESAGQWFPLDTELILMDGEIAGTKNATCHMLLLDCRFEVPVDHDTQTSDFHRKLELLNGIMIHDRKQRQAQYLGNSGYSEDSDYTSDLNYPIGQNANSSASQYRNLRTPQRSLETSRENSYEKDDNYIIQQNHHNKQQDFESDPLFYNSRPLNAYDKVYSSGIKSYSNMRKKSLERQDTSYDEYGSENTYYNDNYFQADDNHSYYDVNCESENRQWDSGGSTVGHTGKILPTPPIQHSNSVNDEYYNSDECVSLVSRGASLPATPISHQNSTHRLLPKPNVQVKQSLSNIWQSPRQLPVITPNKRKIPDIKTISTVGTYYTEQYYNDRNAIYNENYNYAYESADNLTLHAELNRNRKTLPTVPLKASSNHNRMYTKENVSKSSTYISSSCGVGVNSANIYSASTTIANLDSNKINYQNNSVSTSPLDRKIKKLPIPQKQSKLPQIPSPNVISYNNVNSQYNTYDKCDTNSYYSGDIGIDNTENEDDVVAYENTFKKYLNQLACDNKLYSSDFYSITTTCTDSNLTTTFNDKISTTYNNYNNLYNSGSQNAKIVNNVYLNDDSNIDNLYESTIPIITTTTVTTTNNTTLIPNVTISTTVAVTTTQEEGNMKSNQNNMFYNSNSMIQNNIDNRTNGYTEYNNDQDYYNDYSESEYISTGDISDNKICNNNFTDEYDTMNMVSMTKPITTSLATSITSSVTMGMDSKNLAFNDNYEYHNSNQNYNTCDISLSINNDNSDMIDNELNLQSNTTEITSAISKPQFTENTTLLSVTSIYNEMDYTMTMTSSPNNKLNRIAKQETQCFVENDEEMIEYDEEESHQTNSNYSNNNKDITITTTSISNQSQLINTISNTTALITKTNEENDFYNHYTLNDDYFNEEDEYKYLEEEGLEDEDNNYQRYIEENDDLLMHDNYNFISVNNKQTIESNGTVNNNKKISQPQSQRQSHLSNFVTPGSYYHQNLQPTTHHSLIDSKINQSYLNKQDSILEEEEEDEEEIGEKINDEEMNQLNNEMDEESKDDDDLESINDSNLEKHNRNLKYLEEKDEQSDQLGNLITTTDLTTKKKSLIRGETEEITSSIDVTTQIATNRKSEVTAKQRWHWAYNKIIMQLNNASGTGDTGSRPNGHPSDNPFYSNIDSMPDIRPRRKSIPLVSELVSNFFNIIFCINKLPKSNNIILSSINH